MSKRTLISAYGVPSDRDKLEALAAVSGKSSSAWIIDQIRKQFATTFNTGAVPPQERDK